VAPKKPPFQPTHFVLLREAYPEEDALLSFAKKRDCRILLVVLASSQALDAQVRRLCLATKHITVIYRIRDDIGAAILQALICLVNMGATHAISLVDVSQAQTILAQCKTTPETLLLDGMDRILAYPLALAAPILNTAELSQGTVFATEFLLHWRRRKLSVQTLSVPCDMTQSFWEKLAIFGAKVRFYLQAPKQKRCWVEPNIRV